LRIGSKISIREIYQKNNMLVAKNINKKIDGRDILKDISFSLESGEIISIIGPSGSGKTTFLRAISLIDFPDSGSLEIGEDKYRFPINQTENIKYPYPNLTVVFQQFFIWPHLTIRENITLALRGDIDKKHFDEVVGLFQMNEFLDRYPNEVSLGQRQRAVLVRALMLKPKYLFLDEVTSALDIEQSYLILSHLKQIAERGVGIVFVSHAIHLARKISNKIIFFDDGMIIEEGNSDILNNPKTDRLKKFINISDQII
jgi:ABC-type polar amino acid transport system ATPase subunit